MKWLYFRLAETETEKRGASGHLKPIAPVICNQNPFSFLDIGGIIPNEKEKGYRKQLMSAIRDHLIAYDAVDLAACWREA